MSLSETLNFSSVLMEQVLLVSSQKLRGAAFHFKFVMYIFSPDNKESIVGVQVTAEMKVSTFLEEEVKQLKAGYSRSIAASLNN